MGKDEKSIYKESANRHGITENASDPQNMQTRETKTLESDSDEVLIGKDIDEIKKISESHESLQSRILNKMMK